MTACNESDAILAAISEVMPFWSRSVTMAEANDQAPEAEVTKIQQTVDV
jgi:hypothetical protein